VKSRRTESRTAVALLVVALAGCVGVPDIPNERAYAGRHVTLHVSRDRRQPICPAAVEGLDRFVETVAEMFGVPPPRAEYFLPLNWSEIGCSNGAAGCAYCSGGNARSVLWEVVHHELVHLATCPAGDPPPFLREGAAEALSRLERPRVLDARRLEDHLRTDAWESIAIPDRARLYFEAGSFARFVIARFGREAFVRCYRAVPYSASDDAIAAGFLDATGGALSDALVAWRRAEPLPGQPAPPSPLGDLACFAPSLEARTAGAWHFEADTIDAACESVRTTFDETHAIDVSEPGVYALAAAATADVATDVIACRDALTLAAINSAVPAVRLLRLDAGRYAIRQAMTSQGLVAPRGALSRRWDLRRVAGLDGGCDQAPAIRLDAATPRASLALTGPFAPFPTGATTAWLRVTADAPTVRLAMRTTFLGGTLFPTRVAGRACRGTCASPGDCRPVVLDGTSAVQIDAGGELVLELEVSRENAMRDVSLVVSAP
jgi:hypothetical protein